MKIDSNIIIKDPLYKQILVSPRHKKIIDSKYFQRLREIKQTSFCEYVYPSANHTRFSHSLGAYHLMKKVLGNSQHEDLSYIEKESLLLAALLHDIGHGPFSHSWERVFPHFDHEKATVEILKKFKLFNVIKVIEKKNKYYPLISSTIDVDKLDYMARDSYFAGVSYGVAEVDFIIQHMYVNNGKLMIKPSSVSSVEDLITQRVNLFKTVYFHKIAIEYDFLFIKIFQRVKEIIKETNDVYINNHLKAFFEEKNTIDDLIALTDNDIRYHIKVWSTSKDPILRNLCNMFLNRTKFKVINLAYNKVDVNKLADKVAKEYNLRYFFGHIKLLINIIQTPIYVDFGDNKFKRLDEVSDLIKFYTKQNWKVEFVILPRDIKV